MTAMGTALGWVDPLRWARFVLDLVLPPRCPACGEIVGALHSFCAPCWVKLDFLGSSGCTSCGIPIEGSDVGTCAGCLVRPPLIARTRAAVAYGEVSRALAIHLKYGRKIALAKAMARYMAPLLGDLPAGAVLTPVPLHRRRLAARGFNQSLLIAREIGRLRGVRVDPWLLRRTRPTLPLKGMSFSQRQRTVAGAFALRRRADVAGRTIVIIDDVLTTGSTADACARTLDRGGADRIELLCWSRVVRNPIFIA